MLSATRMVGLAAVLALLGGLTLALPIGAPDTEPDPVVTDIEAGTGEITNASGSIEFLAQDTTVDAEHFDWGAVKNGDQWTMRWEMSDPRISGVETHFQNNHELGALKRRVFTFTGRLFTDEPEGTWLQSGRAYQDPETAGIQMQVYSVGEGSYSGLTAISSCVQERVAFAWDCEGAIFENGLPESPAEPPSEIPAVHLEP